MSSSRAEDHADGVEQVALDALLAASDVVTLHARVTAETRGLIDRAAVRAHEARRLFHQHGARAAGRLRRALRRACRPAICAAPCSRPSPSSRRRRTGRCCSSTNVTLTPHIAGASLKTVRIAAAMVAEEVRRFICAASRSLNPVPEPSIRRPIMTDDRTQVAPGDHREVPLDERARPQPGHLRQHLSVRYGDGHADHAERRALSTRWSRATIASMPLAGEYGTWEGPLKPSTEWRFHLDIMRARPEVGAIVHAHPTYCHRARDRAARRSRPATT